MSFVVLVGSSAAEVGVVADIIAAKIIFLIEEYIFDLII